MTDPGTAPLPLATSRFSARALVAASGLAPVRISVGHPRWHLGYELAGACKFLMPTRPMLKLPEPEYRALYYEILDKTGVTRIDDELRTIAETSGKPGLVLLCFEDLAKPGEWCHRRMFADYWREKIGQEVPELAPPLRPAQGSLFGEGGAR